MERFRLLARAQANSSRHSGLLTAGLNQSARYFMACGSAPICRSTQQNRNRFVGGRPGFDVVMIECHQDVRFGIIGSDRALRDIVGDRRQIAHNALARFRPRIGYDAEIDQIAVLQTSAAQVSLIDEYDITTPCDPTIAIVHAVDRCVVLIMTSNRRERKSFTIRYTQIFIQTGVDQKICLLRRCSPLSFRRSNI